MGEGTGGKTGWQMAPGSSWYYLTFGMLEIFPTKKLEKKCINLIHSV